jgi:pimeloyl-ACP methyl ester carboxylesterase
LERLAEDVHVLMVGLDMAPAAVVAHSMGGMVAQQLAVSHPEDLCGLVLVATTSADPQRALISVRIAAEASEYGYRRAFNTHFPKWFPPDADSNIVAWVKSQMLRTPEHVALSLVENYRNLDFRADLRGIRVPTLVIEAEADVSTPSANSVLIAALVPGAKRVVVKRAGHFVQLEHPMWVGAAIEEFLLTHEL